MRSAAGCVLLADSLSIANFINQSRKILQFIEIIENALIKPFIDNHAASRALEPFLAGEPDDTKKKSLSIDQAFLGVRQKFSELLRG